MAARVVRCESELKAGVATSPLLVASCYDNTEIVATLLGEGADVAATDSSERTSLLLATQHDQLAVVKVGGRGGTIHRCIDMLRYFSRDTYRDIIFYNPNFFFFLFHKDFHLGRKET